MAVDDFKGSGYFQKVR